MHNKVSEDELVTGSELDAESGLVEVLSGESLLGALLDSDMHGAADNIDDVAACVACAGSDASSLFLR